MRFLSACITFILASVLAAVIFGFLFAGLSPVLAWSALSIGFIGGTVAWRSTTSVSYQDPTAWDYTALGVFTLVSLRAFLWLIYQDGNDWKVLSPNNLGDISKHIQIIRYLAVGANFWPENPFYAGEPLCYYIGTDVFNSLLTLTGVPVERGLVWIGLLGAGLTGWSLWKWGRSFALAGLLFNGGFAGFAIFSTFEFADFQSDLAWKNLFLAIFVTQRAFLYALPAGLLLLFDWRERYFGGTPCLPRWLGLLLYSTLPIFAAHAFLALSIVLLSLFIFQSSARKSLLQFVGLAFLPASLCMWLVTGGFSLDSGIRFLPGWMQGEAGLWFWILNFGISLPLLCVLAWRIVVDPDRTARSFAAAGLALFAICTVVAFAPWPWDNTKIMIWGWIICLPFLWEKVLAPCRVEIRWIVIISLFFSGAVSLVGGLDARHGYRLIGRNELDQARAALAVVPALDPIATTTEYNNPAVLLGRPVICGYEGMLWAHGLDYRSRWILHEKVLAREPGWPEIARKIGAKWLYLPPSRAVSSEKP